MTIEQDIAVRRYIASIRSLAKKNYAARYADWIVCGSSGEEPPRDGLSYMGAQAVRVQLHELGLTPQ